MDGRAPLQWKSYSNIPPIPSCRKGSSSRPSAPLESWVAFRLVLVSHNLAAAGAEAASLTFDSSCHLCIFGVSHLPVDRIS